MSRPLTYMKVISRLFMAERYKATDKSDHGLHNVRHQRPYGVKMVCRAGWLFHGFNSRTANGTGTKDDTRVRGHGQEMRTRILHAKQAGREIEGQVTLPRKQTSGIGYQESVLDEGLQEFDLVVDERVEVHLRCDGRVETDHKAAIRARICNGSIPITIGVIYGKRRRGIW